MWLYQCPVYSSRTQSTKWHHWDTPACLFPAAWAVHAHRAGLWGYLCSPLPWTVGWSITALLGAAKVCQRCWTGPTPCAVRSFLVMSVSCGKRRVEGSIPCTQAGSCARLHRFTHKVWGTVLGQVNHRCYLNLFSDTGGWHSHCWYVPQAVIWCSVGAIFLFRLKALQCNDRQKYADALKMSKSTCSVAKNIK